MAKRVLVVDDEKLIVKGIRYSLEQDSMIVEVAYFQLLCGIISRRFSFHSRIHNYSTLMDILVITKMHAFS